MRLIIYAVNVHQGGGAVLLNALFPSINQKNVSCVIFADRRLKLPETISARIQINRVAPSIVGRFLAEVALKGIAKDDDIVLFFGNLPPLFKLSAKAILFIQNRYLVDYKSLNDFDIKSKLRITLERIWLKIFRMNIDKFIVQSQSMQSCVYKNLGCDAEIMPFIDSLTTFGRSVPEIICSKETEYDFIYVASGEPHKNHTNLVEAWVILASEGIFPFLCLTLDEESNPHLLNWIRNMSITYHLKIANSGLVAQSKMAELYRKSKALIYPSTFESFGLPLIEARNANVAIVASELDYVRDILDPEETFDPSSPQSISRAVKRFLAYDEKDLPLVDASAFLENIFNQNSGCD